MSVADQTADAVVVGGGTIGAWCAYFLRQAGLGRVVLLEKGLLGQGASSRAAGVVRMQGGTPEAVRLGQWSRGFYLSQKDEIGTDSGFTEQGYLLPCFTEAEVAAAHARRQMQSALGVPVRWLGPDEVDAANPTLAPGQTLGGTFCAQDGFIRPPRNVAAYTAALLRSGVEIRERVAFGGLADDDRTVETSQGRIGAGLVVLTGFWWFTMWFLLAGRVSWRRLFPCAVATGAFFVGMLVVFSFTFSGAPVTSSLTATTSPASGA
jgi:sarcosine oxidase subunit beta